MSYSSRRFRGRSHSGGGDISSASAASLSEGGQGHGPSERGAMTAPHTPRTDASTSSYASGSGEVRSHARRLELHDAFVVDTRLHGKGPILFKWDPLGKYVASTGSSRVVHIFDVGGNMVDQVVPPSPSRVSGLEWDPHMGTLAIMQEHSKVVVMWNASSQTRKMLDVGVKDGLWMSWSTSRNLLALGTSRGRVLIYDTEDCSRVQVRTEHRRSVTAGAWNKSNCLAFVSDARSVTMCSAEGEILDRFKVKGKPLSVERRRAPPKMKMPFASTLMARAYCCTHSLQTRVRSSCDFSPNTALLQHTSGLIARV